MGDRGELLTSRLKKEKKNFVGKRFSYVVGGRPLAASAGASRLEVSLTQG